MLNVEHIAQRNFSAARTTARDGYRQAVADSGEAPIYAGVVNRAPLLDRLVERGVVDYGVHSSRRNPRGRVGRAAGSARWTARPS
jgi:hypothetical protein